MVRQAPGRVNTPGKRRRYFYRSRKAWRKAPRKGSAKVDGALATVSQSRRKLRFSPGQYGILLEPPLAPRVLVVAEILIGDFP
jgi:hypothetical protein